MKCVFISIAMLLSSTLSAADKPNIILIMADDLGNHSFRFPADNC